MPLRLWVRIRWKLVMSEYREIVVVWSKAVLVNPALGLAAVPQLFLT